MTARSDGLVAGTPKLGMFAVLLGLYAGAFLLLAWPWLSGAVTIPWDAKSHFQPELQFLAHALAHGQSPFWTPNVYAGWPQIADPQSLIFSPLHLALAALIRRAELPAGRLVTFAYLSLGSIGWMLYFRDRGWHPGGAIGRGAHLRLRWLGGVALQHTGQIISLAYLPISLWLLARTTGTRLMGLRARRRGCSSALLAVGRDQVAGCSDSTLIVGLCARFWLDGPGRLARLRRRCCRSSRQWRRPSIAHRHRAPS